MTKARTIVAEAGDANGSMAPAADRWLIRAEKLRKVFRSGNVDVTALAGVDIEVAPGEMVAFVGPSGAGKSTLLHLLAALDTPTSGTVYFDGNSFDSLGDAGLIEFRTRAVGFVWQRHHLLPDFTAAENVAMPLLIRGVGQGKAARTALRWLGEVGLGERAQHCAGELSGGEQQRVAIARALVNEPKLLLADEPTGSLDERNAESFFELLQGLHRAHRLTSVLATHNFSLARRADRAVVLEHGSLRTIEAASAGRTAGRGKISEGECG